MSLTGYSKQVFGQTFRLDWAFSKHPLVLRFPWHGLHGGYDVQFVGVVEPNSGET